MKSIFEKGRGVLTRPQDTILSAAGVIMIMTLFSAVLGLVRRRVILAFLVPEQFALFEAAFRLPDLFTSIVVLGTLSSAFIPIFTKLHKQDEKRAWGLARELMNAGLAAYAVFVLVFIFFTSQIYSIIAPGYTPEEIATITSFSRVIFLAQGFFVASYVMTGVLESLRRFLIPALAPIFYNIGIISGTIILYPTLGMIAPVVGVVVGAAVHFLMQFVFVMKIGFRYKLSFMISRDVKSVTRLASPRMLELSLLQVSKIFELFLASLISTASYAYYSLAVSIQSLPVTIFGTSIAKAALPTFAAQADEPDKFRNTLLTTLYQVAFFVIPIAALLIVLRVPIVRLLFGTDIFDWPATVQTGLVLSSFAVGVPFQASVLVLTRAFYALGDTRTPVKISLVGTFAAIITGAILVIGMGLPTWGLAASFALGQAIQAIVLFIVIGRRLNHGTIFSLTPILKSLASALFASLVMYFVLKFFDRSVWIKSLSFLGQWDGARSLNFESFVLDTRYTFNLFVLTGFTAALGMSVYLVSSFILRSRELLALLRLIKRRDLQAPKEEQEQISPTTGESGQV